MNKLSIGDEKLITGVDLYSIGGLCEPDLTGSCHLLVLTYADKTKKIIQLDAGFFQKKGSQHKNQEFPEILREIMPGCIILSHEHLDHTGRLVIMHKALRERHNVTGIPIIMSEASRKLLPHVLKALHEIKDGNMVGFDQNVARANSELQRFVKEYTRKPRKAEASRTDHRSSGERRQETIRDNKQTITELEESFLEWGGSIEKSILIIPEGLEKKENAKLRDIIREIRRLQKPELSGVMTSGEANYFKQLKEKLAPLYLDNDFFEKLDALFEEIIPRTNRKERDKRATEALELIEKAIAEKRESLLPDITPEDVQTTIQQSKGKQTKQVFEAPQIPHVSIELFNTAHMLGAVGVKLIFKMVQDQVKTLLFSGDIGSWNKETLHGAPELPEERVDALIMESTYAGKKHENIEKQKRRILDFLKEKKGPIIMPVFSLDRMYVVLHALQEEILSGKIKQPIYWRNQLGEATLEIYKEYYPELATVLGRIQVLSGQAGGKKAYALAASDESCILFASGGTLIEGSTAFGLLQERAESGKDINLLFTGFQPGELGKIIMDFVLSGDDLEEKCEIRIGAFHTEITRGNILCTGIFSGHGDQADLERYGDIGEKILLVHGNPRTAPALAKKLGAEIVRKNTLTKLF